MEQQLSDVLDNLLGLLLLEGSYEIEETDESMNVSIETSDAGRLIGARGESLESLQLLINQMMSRKMGELVPSELVPSAVEVVEGFKRVHIDVSGWRKQKEEDLTRNATEWAKEVLQTGQMLELEPMPAWQRRIVHMVVSELDGVESESIGEGRDRHIAIKIKNEKVKSKNKNNDAEDKED